MKNILVLYSEVMGYNLGCFRELALRSYHVHCVRWDKNKKTPYVPVDEQGITFYLRSENKQTDLLKIAQNIKPELIFVSGWMDKDYLKVCKYYKKKIPVISSLDNWWTGSLRQTIACKLSFFLVRPYFSHLFVPGLPQLKYAEKLGYSKEKILQGLYTCDRSVFDNPQLADLSNKKIIYVGRYHPIKGILPFLKAFNDISSQIPEWSFVLYGNGELKEELLGYKNSQIEINDFVEPQKLADVMKSSSVFCLPSIHEPWGLVIHEASSSGLPLLVSNNIGACTSFFKNDINGFSFNINDDSSIKTAILKICQKSDESLRQFAQKSYDFSKSNSPQIWADKLLSIL